jgi:hypothetical protein
MREELGEESLDFGETFLNAGQISERTSASLKHDIPGYYSRSGQRGSPRPPAVVTGGIKLGAC